MTTKEEEVKARSLDFGAASTTDSMINVSMTSTAHDLEIAHGDLAKACRSRLCNVFHDIRSELREAAERDASIILPSGNSLRTIMTGDSYKDVIQKVIECDVPEFKVVADPHHQTTPLLRFGERASTC